LRDEMIQEIAELSETILEMLNRVSSAVVSDKKEADDFRLRVIRLIKLTQDLNESTSQDQRATNSLLMALIEELAITKAVSPSAVAARHLSKMQSNPISFSRPALAHSKHVAELLSHRGFPDNVPDGHGRGPTLIVDNDQPEA
jgi:uncharacterized membrane protein YqiK